MRLIGLAVILAVGLILAPLAVEAQQAAKVARIGWVHGAAWRSAEYASVYDCASCHVP